MLRVNIAVVHSYRNSMSGNKTSEAIDDMLEGNTDLRWVAKDEGYRRGILIAKKYKKMEEALGRMNVCKRCQECEDVAIEALDFDPLDE